MKIFELGSPPAQELHRCYSLYSSLFPDRDESESEENIEKYLAYKDEGHYGVNDYHVLCAAEGDEVLGVAIFDYYAKPAIGFIEFLGVAPSYEGHGLGSELLDAVIRTMEGDAERAGSSLDGLLIEVEDPKLVDRRATAALFWERMGFRQLMVSYVQPALQEGKRPVEHLMLMFRALRAGGLKRSILLSALAHYFHFAMDIEKPQDADEFKLVFEDLCGYGRVEPPPSGLTLDELHEFLASRCKGMVDERAVGGAILDGLSVHYMCTMDLTRGEVDPVEALCRRLRTLGWATAVIGNAGSTCREREGVPDFWVEQRSRQDQLDYTEEYKKRRFITRFRMDTGGNGSGNDRLAVMDRQNRKPVPVKGSVEVHGSLNSIGVLAVDVTVHFERPMMVADAIAVGSGWGLLIGGKPLQEYAKSAIWYLLGEGLSGGWAMDSYPLFIATGYEGELSGGAIYGLVRLDDTFDHVSKRELSSYLGAGESKRDLSVVEGILALYEPQAALIAAKDARTFVDHFEEITGESLGRFTESIGDIVQLDDAVVRRAELEYALEVEQLRVQYSVLHTLAGRLIDRELSESYAGEYSELLAAERRIKRRMVELGLLDIERYSSTREALKEAQRHMGLDELYDMVTRMHDNLMKELQVRYQLYLNDLSYLLNVLVFILIAFSVVEPVMIALGMYYQSLYAAGAAIAAELGALLVFRSRGRRRWSRSERDRR